MSRMSRTAVPDAGAAVWIGSLLKRFPELVAELAPAAHGGLRERRGGGPSGYDRSRAAARLRCPARHHRRCRRAGGGRAGAARSAVRATRPGAGGLRRIAGLLERVAADPVLAAHVEDETRRMAARCARTLGDPEQLVRLPGRCPACDSVSLRAFPERAEVRCVNPACKGHDTEAEAEVAS
ncbi:hypothetical protein O1M54_23685 [Streptomyces diastatochromogenes]|nr:hypothetical protein [Streptomyces diastatochromogenes]